MTLRHLNSGSQIELLYSLSKNSFTTVVEFLVNGLSTEGLKDLAATRLVVPFSECPRIRYDSDDTEDEWLEAAVSFYKHNKFNKQAPVRILIRGQPGIDTGSVRRQFFRIVFSRFADPSSPLYLFEGLQNRLKPAYKASVLSSGLLKIFRTLVAHSFLLDGQGFPYLAEYCFYYLAGKHD